MALFNESYAQVTLNSELKAVVLSWKGFANEEQYKKAVHAALDVLIEHKLPHWISDMRESKAVSPKMKEWIRTEILPLGVEAGAKKMAVTLSKDIFHKMYVETLVPVIENSGVIVQYFDSMEKIEEWLKSDK